MNRGASAEFIAEILKSTSSPCYLVDVWFDAGTVSMTDAWLNIVYDGRTYTANGHYMGFAGLSEHYDMTIPTVTLTISGVDQTWIARVLSQPYIDRRVTIFKAFLDYTTLALIASPVLIFDGRMDTMSIQDDPSAGTCTVSGTASSQWSDFQRTPGRHTNDTEQQIFYPGDRGFEFSAQLNQNMKWGLA